MPPTRRQHSLCLLALLLGLGPACSPEPAISQEARSRSAAQLRPVPGCEGCEAAWERDGAALPSRIRLAPAGEPGEPMLLQGVVLQADRKTPAAGVVVYLYHTNAAGVYGTGSNESEWSRRHGRLRGWLKTGADGRYAVETVKPGQYPDRREPAHVHITLLEPGKDPYFIDDVVFAGESGVNAAYRAERQDRGGSGIVQLRRDAGGRWLAERNIVLERRSMLSQ